MRQAVLLLGLLLLTSTVVLGLHDEDPSGATGEDEEEVMEDVPFELPPEDPRPVVLVLGGNGFMVRRHVLTCTWALVPSPSPAIKLTHLD